MSDRSLPLLADDVVGHAEHGQWCPKLCNHTCPVLAATGRSDAVPWGFHRTVADLAAGTLRPADAAGRLVACTGCRACAGGCAIEGQDVPAQVRAGRAAVHAAGASAPAVATAAAGVDVGRSPYGVEGGRSVRATRPDVQLLAGCRDRPATVAAAVRLLAEADQSAQVVVPAGCCGSALRDLGAVEEADAASAAMGGRLRDDIPVVLLDPHCRGEAVVAVGEAGVVDLVAHLAALVEDGTLAFDGAPQVVRWHEPCLLVGTTAGGAGRVLLAAAGALVDVPTEAHHGCSGAGMGMPLLDPDAAATVAARRAGRLRGPGPIVSGCAGAVGALDDATGAGHHLVDLLASLLDDTPESVA